MSRLSVRKVYQGEYTVGPAGDPFHTVMVTAPNQKKAFAVGKARLIVEFGREEVEKWMGKK